MKIQYDQIGVLTERQSSRKIMLDFDRRRTPRLMWTFTCLRWWGLTPTDFKDIRTRKGWHRVIEVREHLTPGLHVAIQAILESDPKREALNVMRLLAIERHKLGRWEQSRWNLLFERKLKP